MERGRSMMRSTVRRRTTVRMASLLVVAGCGSGSPNDAPGTAGTSAVIGAGAGAGAAAGTGGTVVGASGAGAGGAVATAGAQSTGGSGATGGVSGLGGSSGMTSAAGAGGAGTGGAGSGGAGTGGASGSGGTTGAGAGGAPSAYPCDGDPNGYDAVVSNSGGSWIAQRGSDMVYSGADMRAAMQAGIDSLDPGRTSKQSVLVQGSGSIAANARVSVASYTILNVCGTIDVTGSGSGDMAPIYARDRSDIEIPNLSLTGAPVYGMFFRDVDNLHLGQIDLRLSSGLGIRIDNHGRTDRADKVTNIRIDHVYVEGTSTQGVETYGVDDITIGTVVARNTGDSGLLLNDTTHAEIGLVDAIDAGTGTGYAAFRMANRNGRVDGAYPVNIHVGEVIARGGGRGIFCVSESGGAVIDRVDIADTGNNSILIENCYNVNIAAEGGSVTGGGDIRIAARTEFANSSQITIQNLTVTDSAINENPCADDSTFLDNTLVRSASNVCN